LETQVSGKLFLVDCNYLVVDLKLGLVDLVYCWSTRFDKQRVGNILCPGLVDLKKGLVD